MAHEALRKSHSGRMLGSTTDHLPFDWESLRRQPESQWDPRTNTSEVYVPQMAHLPFPEGVYRASVELPPFEYLRKEGGHQLLIPRTLEFKEQSESEVIQALRHNQALQERNLNSFGIPSRDYDQDVSARIRSLELKLLDEQKQKLEVRKDRLASQVADKSLITSDKQEQMLQAEIISLKAVIQQREAIIESFRRQQNTRQVESDLPGIESSQAKIFKLQAERVYEEAYNKMKFNLDNLRAHNAILLKSAQSLQHSLLSCGVNESEDLELMAVARTKMLNEKINAIRGETYSQQRQNLVRGSGEFAELESVKLQLELQLQRLDQTKGLAIRRLDGVRDQVLRQPKEQNNLNAHPAGVGEVRRQLLEENAFLTQRLAELERGLQDEQKSREFKLIEAKQEASIKFSQMGRELLSKLINTGVIPGGVMTGTVN